MENAKDWLIVANGEPISASKLIALAKNKRTVILDGALNDVIGMLLPAVVLGDFDSISPDLLLTLEDSESTILIHAPDPNATDLEKALRYVISFEPKSIHICQATGRRLDHTLYNLRLLKKFHDQCREIFIISDTEKMVYLQNESVTVSAESPQPLALLSFPEAYVTSHGLQYDMDDYQLAFAKQESVSNTLLNQQATIDVKGDALLIVSHETTLQRD